MAKSAAGQAAVAPVAPVAPDCETTRRYVLSAPEDRETTRRYVLPRRQGSGFRCMECGRPASFKVAENGVCPFCGGGDFDMPGEAEAKKLAARYAELKKDRG